MEFGPPYDPVLAFAMQRSVLAGGMVIDSDLGLQLFGGVIMPFRLLTLRPFLLSSFFFKSGAAKGIEIWDLELPTAWPSLREIHLV